MSVDVSPEPSVAVTTNVLAPTARVIAPDDQVAVPVAFPVVPVVWFLQETDATETLSVAEPPRVIVFEVVAYVADAVGAVIVTTGGVFVVQLGVVTESRVEGEE